MLGSLDFTLYADGWGESRVMILEVFMKNFDESLVLKFRT